MKLTKRGKILLGIFYTVMFLAAEWCLITIVFRRDETIWLLALGGLTIIGCLTAMVHDSVQEHIHRAKTLYEESFK